MTETRPLALHRWDRPVDASDEAVLAHCFGPTIDIGCGPGRMSAHLSRMGRLALGVDLVKDSVHQAVERGATALHRDVFAPLPGEGRWETALLADGNIGIGGDPVRLLQRVRTLLVPGGRAVVELGGPGTAVVNCWASLEARDRRSRPFRWATLGVDDVDRVAAAAGFHLASVSRLGERWVAVLTEGVS
jgi:SAM-dependent methyltransferase